MSVQYRAIWQDDRLDLIDIGIDIFQEWMNTKNIGLDIPSEGIVSNESNEIRVDKVSEGATQALRICLDESRPKTETIQKWTTIAHWMTDGTNGWIWIDLEYESSDISYTPRVFAPKLIAMLLDTRNPSSGYPHLGPQPLRISSEADVDNMVDSLFDKERSIPIIVYSTEPTLTKRQYEERVNSAARRLAGCADIRMLTKDTQDIFHNLLDHISMSVFGGAVRIYLPGIDPHNPEPWKHRYIQARFLSEDPLRSSSIVATRVLPRIIARPPPALYTSKIRYMFGRKNRDWEEIALALDEDYKKLDGDKNKLKNKMADLIVERDIAIEDAMESERIAYRSKSYAERLATELRERGKNPDIIEQDLEGDTDLGSCNEAIEIAKRKLSCIVIHPDAPRDIDRMDQHEYSELWGYKVYRHLRSLNTYSEQKKTREFEGGFWNWCKNSGHDDAIHTRFVAMKESEYVMTNKYLKPLRDLPIDKSVDPSGKIQMQPHLKPVEGGGLTIPRIYFFDDTKGKTGKVHIGFIGPHDLMGNKSAN